MRKATLEGNILPKAKQRLVITGLSATAEVIHPVTRDQIEMSLGVIELPDQTKVPGGRVRAGEFNLTLQFARDIDRRLFCQWFKMCKDAGTDTAGIDPNYKKNGYLLYHRLFYGTPDGTNPSGSGKTTPLKVNLYGLWPSRITFPDFDINADEGDGDCMLEMGLQFDDVDIPDDSLKQEA